MADHTSRIGGFAARLPRLLFVAKNGHLSNYAKSGGKDGTLVKFTAINVCVIGVRTRIPDGSSGNLLRDN
jgi:hypothetical protein